MALFTGADNLQSALSRWPGDLAMGTGSDTQIIAKLPIVEIMSGLCAGFGIGGNLILQLTGFSDQFLPWLLNLPQRIVLRPR